MFLVIICNLILAIYLGLELIKVTKKEDKYSKKIELYFYLCLNLSTNFMSLVYNIILGFTYLLFHKKKTNKL